MTPDPKPFTVRLKRQLFIINPYPASDQAWREATHGQKDFFAALIVFSGIPVFAGETIKPTCDGTPRYGETVMQSYRMLQFKTSIYETVPAPGQGIRLGIYQAQAACGKGAKLIVGPTAADNYYTSPTANGAASPTPTFQSC